MTAIRQAIRKVLGMIGNAVPEPPPAETPPPDVDGRREVDRDAERTSLDVQLQPHGSGGGSGGTLVSPPHDGFGPPGGR